MLIIATSASMTMGVFQSLTVIVILLLRAGAIESNPGPKKTYKSYEIFNISDLRMTISRKRTTLQMEEDYKRNLFSRLPRITSKEYIGRDYCHVCWKIVTARHSATSCDKCLNWMHRTCSDMPANIYRQLQQQSNFKWICSLCREDDTYDGPTPVATVTPSHSTELSSLTPGAIMHYNCRSANGKLDEIQKILHDAQPAILILTETWLDESNPKGTP